MFKKCQVWEVSDKRDHGLKKKKKTSEASQCF